MNIETFRNELEKVLENISNAYDSLGNFIEEAQTEIKDDDLEIVEGYLIKRMNRFQKELESKL